MQIKAESSEIVRVCSFIIPKERLLVDTGTSRYKEKRKKDVSLLAQLLYNLSSNRRQELVGFAQVAWCDDNAIV